MNDLTLPGDFIPEDTAADDAAPEQSITVTVTPLTSVEQVSRFIAGVGRSPAVREVALIHFTGESGRFRIVEQPQESVVPALLHLDGFPVEEFTRLGRHQFALRIRPSGAGERDAGPATPAEPLVREVTDGDHGEPVADFFAGDQAPAAPCLRPGDQSIPAAFRDALPDTPDVVPAAPIDATDRRAEEPAARDHGDDLSVSAETHESPGLDAPGEIDIAGAGGAPAAIAAVPVGVAGLPPEGAAPQQAEEPALTRSERSGADSLTLVAYPFSSFSYLNTFIGALSALPGTKSVAPRRFRGGTLHLAVDYAGDIPLASLITQIPEFRPKVVSETDDTLTVVVESP